MSRPCRPCWHMCSLASVGGLMLSSLSFEWKRAIRFDSAFAAKLDELVMSFQRAVAREMVSAAGLNPTEYPDSASLQAREVVGSEQDYIHRQLVRDVSKIETARWSVILADETKIDNMDTAQFLGLNNVGGLTISSAIIDSRSSDYAIYIGFRNRKFFQTIEIAISGPIDIVQKYRSDVSVLLQEFSQPWWLFRDSRFLWAVFGLPLIGLNILTIRNAIYGAAAPLGLNSALFLMGVLGVVGLLAMPMMNILIPTFNWIFPMTDFVFGGGIQRSAVRLGIRRAMWGVPILSVVIPYVVNQL